MRPLLTLSIVLLITGLALGLLNLYIDGRIGTALLLGVIIALAMSVALFISRK